MASLLFARALPPVVRTGAARPSLAAAAAVATRCRRFMSTATTGTSAAGATSAAAAAAAVTHKRPQAVTAALKSAPVAAASVPRRAAHAGGGAGAGAGGVADPIKGSHMSVRRWKVLPGASVAQIVRMCDTEFVPLIRSHPDFLCYYATVVKGASAAGAGTGGTGTGDGGEYFSVSVFSSKKGADAAAKIAADWSARNLKDKIALFDRVDGETVVHHDSWTHMMAAQSEG